MPHEEGRCKSSFPGAGLAEDTKDSSSQEGGKYLPGLWKSSVLSGSGVSMPDLWIFNRNVV